jgi:hypothetical protein
MLNGIAVYLHRIKIPGLIDKETRIIYINSNAISSTCII